MKSRAKERAKMGTHFVLNLSEGPPALTGSCLSSLRLRANLEDRIFFERQAFSSPTASRATVRSSSSDSASSSRSDLSFCKTWLR